MSLVMHVVYALNIQELSVARLRQIVSPLPWSEPHRLPNRALQCRSMARSTPARKNDVIDLVAGFSTHCFSCCFPTAPSPVFVRCAAELVLRLRIQITSWRHAMMNVWIEQGSIGFGAETLLPKKNAEWCLWWTCVSFATSSWRTFQCRAQLHQAAVVHWVMSHRTSRLCPVSWSIREQCKTSSSHPPSRTISGQALDQPAFMGGITHLKLRAPRAT